MILIIFLLLFIIVYDMKFAGFNNYYYKGFSLNNSTAIKGICALLIVITHISENLNNIGIMAPISKMGYLWVSIFFFYSGYGLVCSVQSKKNYLKGFLFKRLPSIIIPVFIADMLYQIYSIISDVNFSLSSILYNLVRIDLTVSFSWYVVVILFFYIGFYICFKYFKAEKAIKMMFLFVFGYIILCYYLKVESLWYKSCLPFLLGILCSWELKDLYSFCKKKYWIKLVFILSMFFAISILSIIFHKIFNITLNSSIKGMLTTIAFSLCYIFIIMKLEINNSISRFFGKISYELYLIHGLVLGILRGEYIYIYNNFEYTILVIGISSVLALILNLICSKVMIKYKKIINNTVIIQNNDNILAKK